MSNIEQRYSSALYILFSRHGIADWHHYRKFTELVDNCCLNIEREATDPLRAALWEIYETFKDDSVGGGSRAASMARRALYPNTVVVKL